MPARAVVWRLTAAKMNKIEEMRQRFSASTHLNRKKMTNNNNFFLKKGLSPVICIKYTVFNLRVQPLKENK